MKIAFTVCSANYLPFAKTLADSIIQHNSDYKFIIALADTYKNDTGFFEPHRVIPVQDMQFPVLEEMNSRYNMFELSCALKPYVAEYLLHAYQDCDQLFYFDSDILVFNPLVKAETILQDHCMVLTPHVAKASAYEESIFTELNVLRTGVYNAGFFGINRSKESFEFLDWWKKRLQYHCINDAGHGLFVDQLWLTLAPLYFRSCFILFDPGYNLAYWNFIERTLSKHGENYMVNETYPLVFFHYSGYDIFQSELISKHQKETSFKSSSQYLPLFEKYRQLVIQNNQYNLLAMPVTMGKPEPISRDLPREKNFFKRKYKKWFNKK